MPAAEVAGIVASSTHAWLERMTAKATSEEPDASQESGETPRKRGGNAAGKESSAQAGTWPLIFAFWKFEGENGF